MISRATIDKIFEAARIEEVIGEFVNLKKSGKNYKGFSPFTNETNPSFFVSPAKNIFKCFSSGKGGSVVTFLMEHEHFTYPEALRYLASKYNIEIEEDQQSPEDIEQMNEREALFALNSFAVKYFSEQLLESDEGKAIGLSYLRERDYRMETIRKFELGYSPKDWQAFTEHALSNGYRKEYLVKTGLSIDKDDGKMYDRFRARVVFPVHNLSGRILGFGGRIMISDENKPKYVNSPESDVYNKSQILYGLYFAKSSIVKEDNCYLVEGYTDVITLHQSGIENVVASSGTSLTSEQIRLVKRYTPNITILYDGDAAGIKASFRGIDIILEEGMNVKIVLFPDGEDPDSFARKNRTAELKKFIGDNAADFIKFKTRLLRDETKNDPVKKAGLIRDIVETISLIPDAIYRTVYVKECSAILDIPEQTLMNELNRIIRKRFKKQNDMPAEDLPEPAIQRPRQEVETDTGISEYQERDIIRLLLNYGMDDIIFEELDENKKLINVPIKVAQFIVSDLKQDDIKFQNPVYQSVFEEYSRALEKDFVPDERYFVNHENPEIARVSVDLLSVPYELSRNWVRNRIFVPTERERLKLTVESSVLALKAKEVDRQINRNQKLLKEMDSEEDLYILLEEQKGLKEISRRINAQLSRIVTK